MAHRPNVSLEIESLLAYSFPADFYQVGEGFFFPSVGLLFSLQYTSVTVLTAKNARRYSRGGEKVK